MKAASSPTFTFAGIAIRDSNDHRLREYPETLRARASLPPKAKAKWTGLRHHQRLAATTLLGSLPVRCFFVHADKASLRENDAGFARQSRLFYNWPAVLILERITRFAADLGLDALVTFEKVRGTPPSELLTYLEKKFEKPGNSRMRWDHLRKVEVRDVNQKRGLLAADHVAGAWSAATVPHQGTGIFEPAYLRNLANRVHQVDNRHLGVGIKPIWDDRCLTDLPWWATGPFK